MIDQLQILAERMQDKVPCSFEIRGQVNGSMYSYAPANVTPKIKIHTGILLIPEEIRFKSAMQPMTPKPPLVLGIAPRYKICCYIHPYCCRKTIVSKLMCEHPAFNQVNKILSQKKL
jgi:hypothetical protein